ncbi:MAG: hypothetical protein AAF203_07030 [Pseudomonadota bacterium]
MLFNKAEDYIVILLLFLLVLFPNPIGFFKLLFWGLKNGGGTLFFARKIAAVVMPAKASPKIKTLCR